MYQGKPIWVLAADASRAKIWAASTPSSSLELVHEIESPEGRMHERDLTSDLPGRAFDSLKQCDVIEVDKNYAAMAANELRVRLPEYL